MGGDRGSSSSSGEEDGDADWRAAIDSVTSAATSTKHDSNGQPFSLNGGAIHEKEDEKHKHQNLKHYQIKLNALVSTSAVESCIHQLIQWNKNELEVMNWAQKVLDEMLDKTIQVVTSTAHILEKDPGPGDSGIRLFKRAPSGIVFDHLDELHGPKKRPKLVPGEELNEKSKEYRKQLQSVAIDGAEIIAVAIAARQKSLAKIEAREVAAKAAAKREEERVAELKRIRGERWLPSIAREMRINTLNRR